MVTACAPGHSRADEISSPRWHPSEAVTPAQTHHRGRAATQREGLGEVEGLVPADGITAPGGLPQTKRRRGPRPDGVALLAGSFGGVAARLLPEDPVADS
jgi:hypothetical protein